MKILRLNLKNYKSFRSSGWLSFSPHFSVVIGKNNAGKSALLEAFRLLGNQHRPHRMMSTPIDRLDPQSSADLELTLSGEDLRGFLLSEGNTRSIPILPTLGLDAERRDYISNFFQSPAITLKLKATFQGDLTALDYPSHGLFGQAQNVIYARVAANRASQTADAVDFQPGLHDDLPALVSLLYRSSIYVFRAERLNIGRATATEAKILSPDGTNLSTVLGTLQGNTSWFARYNKHVTEIFPSIRQVSVAVVSNEFEVRIWSVDPATEREDLAIPLQESGTGVGQVLAILCVVMTVKNGLIVIDEPNSFLHPGAAKKLIQILRQYDQHQYVLATHSPELISTAQPEIIHLVRWQEQEGESKVETVDATKVDDLRAVLVEIGVSFSDLFGYDRAIWVEGPTEEICFPLILERLLGRVELGLIFVAVRNTGDFEKKRDRKRLIWDIYSKLSSGALLLPSVVAFSFDREERSERDIEDLKRQSKGRARFISRLTYENYLIDPEAIAALINSLPREGRPDVIPQQVSDWLAENGGKFGAKWNGGIADEEWLKKVHAPSLLKNLLNDLASAGDNFEKTSHSKFLTEWLIDHRPNALAELASHISELVEHPKGEAR